MKKKIVLFLVLFISGLPILAQKATIREENIRLKTYPFSDPNPVPEINRIYPYFKFDGYTNTAVEKDWKMVVLENDFVKVFVCPSVGGKVWGAIEKWTGQEFLYFNHVAKFRNVAMRGPWTSGGLEYNFGDIGHAPSCSTPVNYKMVENPDGSVSCFVGSMDLPSETNWNVEIRLQKDKAFFETTARWFNSNEVPVTYYHWMNAAAKTRGNLEFFYPGANWIGHTGEHGEWPVDNGKQVSFYEKNNFGSYKSYHVLNAYSNFFGGYYHDNDFGFGHLADFDEKPGKKLWIWGLSNEGMIWENLLTDNDGQYIEFQAGKLFNQAAGNLATPFKHREFEPFDTDVMHEIWFPVKGTKGMKAVSEFAVVNVIREADSARIFVSALQKINAELVVTSGEKTSYRKKLELEPLQLVSFSLFADSTENFNIKLEGCDINYSTENETDIVERPLDFHPDFDWNTAFGLYSKALELEKQRFYADALKFYQKSLEKEPAFLPSINRIALEYYRQGNYPKAIEFAVKALSVDTYDPLANYVFGLANFSLGQNAAAKIGFSIATQSPAFRSAAYTGLAKTFTKEKNYQEAIRYAGKALDFNRFNTTALQIQVLSNRKQNNEEAAEAALEQLSEIDPLNLLVAFERVKMGKSTIEACKKQITNELPHEFYLSLALVYHELGCYEEAIEVLNASGRNAEILLWLSQLKSDKTILEQALNASPEYVFPFRTETKILLEELLQTNSNWKLKYYLALIDWHLGLTENAKKLFEACGNEPGFAPFYLAKAALFSGNMMVEKESVERATQLSSSDWRAGLALIKYSSGTGDFEKSKSIALRFFERNPENSVFALEYARALLNLKEYEKGIRFLEKINILPCEGSTDGKLIFTELCTRKALDDFAGKQYKNALVFAEKAKEWPVNLGSGSPYNPDGRLQDYLIANTLLKMKKQKEGNVYFQKIVDYKLPDAADNDVLIYLNLFAFEKLGKSDEAKKLLAAALEKSPENEYLKWVHAKYTNNNSQQIADKLLLVPANESARQKGGTEIFRLLLDVIETIEN
jgi:tetratricopeptide (TPR) repeat protein